MAGALFGAVLPSAAIAQPNDFDFESDWYKAIRPEEVRLGGFVSAHGPESGTLDINPIIILPSRKFDSAFLNAIAPRFQLSGMFNVSGGTSYGAADFLWTVNLNKAWFVEPYLGLAVHNGQLNGPDPDKSSLGCRVLAHIGLNVGYRLNTNWSVMATFDHVSNAQSFSGCQTNQGLNLIGTRVGYSF